MLRSAFLLPHHQYYHLAFANLPSGAAPWAPAQQTPPPETAAAANPLPTPAAPTPPQVELPLGQLAQSLRLPTYAIKRLAHHTAPPLALHHPLPHLGEDQYVPLSQVPQLQAAIEHCRQGGQLHTLPNTTPTANVTPPSPLLPLLPLLQRPPSNVVVAKPWQRVQQPAPWFAKKA
jgi:hypothetical protein